MAKYVESDDYYSTAYYLREAEKCAREAARVRGSAREGWLVEKEIALEEADHAYREGR